MRELHRQLGVGRRTYFELIYAHGNPTLRTIDKSPLPSTNPYSR